MNGVGSIAFNSELERWNKEQEHTSKKLRDESKWGTKPDSSDAVHCKKTIKHSIK
jgi:hypothetical protein